MCNTSKFLLTIIISKEEKIFYNFLLNKMHKLNLLVYVLCISIFGILGFDTINNFKKDFVNQGTEKTESLSTSLASYSQYLQSLN